MNVIRIQSYSLDRQRQACSQKMYCACLCSFVVEIVWSCQSTGATKASSRLPWPFRVLFSAGSGRTSVIRIRPQPPAQKRGEQAILATTAASNGELIATAKKTENTRSRQGIQRQVCCYSQTEQQLNFLVSNCRIISLEGPRIFQLVQFGCIYFLIYILYINWKVKTLPKHWNDSKVQNIFFLLSFPQNKRKIYQFC